MRRAPLRGPLIPSSGPHPNTVPHQLRECPPFVLGVHFSLCASASNLCMSVTAMDYNDKEETYAYCSRESKILVWTDQGSQRQEGRTQSLGPG